MHWWFVTSHNFTSRLFHRLDSISFFRLEKVSIIKCEVWCRNVEQVRKNIITKANFLSFSSYWQDSRPFSVVSFLNCREGFRKSSVHFLGQLIFIKFWSNISQTIRCLSSGFSIMDAIVDPHILRYVRTRNVWQPLRQFPMCSWEEALENVSNVWFVGWQTKRY